MSLENPYQSPESNVTSEVILDSAESERFSKMAMGQKLVIYAVMLYFIAAALKVVVGPFILVGLIISLVLSLVGVFKILAARKSSLFVKILLFVLLFVPLVNLLVLLSINSRATKSLKEAGYKVGFLGASKQ